MARETASGELSTVFVETGGNWFKIIEATQTVKGLAVSKFHLEKFEVVGTGLSQAIAAAFKNNNIPKVPVISCIPRHMVNIRMLELPSTDEDEIVDMVGFQAGKQTPYSKDEIAFDYKMLPSARDGYTRVLLAIVQRGVLRQRYSILEEAGIDVARMSVSSEGLLNWYNGAFQKETSAPGATVLLDIDSSYSDFMVMAGQSPVSTRSILIGADKLMADFDGVKDDFLQELKRSLDVCREESSEIDIGSMVLSGAARNIDGLCEFLSSHLEFSVRSRDCQHDVSKMPAKPALNVPPYSAVSITSLIGLAMAPARLEFNLIPDSVKLRKELVNKARTLTAFGILVMFVMVCSSAFIIAKLLYKESMLKVHQAQVAETAAPAKEIARQLEIIDVVQRRAEPKFAAINLLAEIHAAVPSGTYLEEIDIDMIESKLRLVGSCENRSDVRTLVGQLERSELFISAKSGPTAKDPKTERYVFDVTCLLER